MKLIQDDAVIERIVQLVMDFQNQENTAIPLLEKQLREVDRKTGQPDESKSRKACSPGRPKSVWMRWKRKKDELTAKIADEKLRKPSFNADFNPILVDEIQKVRCIAAKAAQGTD